MTLSELLKNDRFARAAGVEILDIRPGYEKARMEVTPDHINAAGVKGQRGVVDLVPALLQAAVHQDMLAVDLQTMAAAGDALVSAEKAQLHGVHPFQKVHRFGQIFCYDKLLVIIPRFPAVGKL